MGGWVDGWMDGCMDAWMHECMGEWMDALVNNNCSTSIAPISLKRPSLEAQQTK